MGTIAIVGDGRAGRERGTCYENIITAAQGAILLVPKNVYQYVSSMPTVTVLRLHEVGLL